jgi:hypothetical protein
MPEALRDYAPEFDHAPAEEALVEILPQVRLEEHNDNEVRAAPRVGERAGFEIPPAVWGTMVACYALFLALLLAATGGAHAAFAIAISAVYVAMFFGTAKAMLAQAPAQPHSPLASYGGKLATLYGPLGRGAVAAQMLVVPGTVALFGAAVLVIRLAVF